MRLRIANRVFAPRAWAVLVTAAALATFVSLGWWQIGRGREKQALVESFARGTQTSVDLVGDVGVDELPRYQHVRATGHYDPSRQILIDNMPSQAGRPGYRVLTPFVREGADRLLLVDRGWVPLGESREVLPRVDVAAEHRAVAGRLDHLPAPGVRVGQSGSPGDARWPRVLNFPRTQDVEQALGQPVESRIVLLDPAAPDGYERVWRPALQFGPERHLGYAVQWFALAIAVLAIFIALSLQRVPPNAGAVADETP
ncbi:MAG TPA: SURF1 family protein [Steroidobacteraceae bacterium]|nr:SURF1 family protein [Steroidobacteraceae bacterium]